MTCVVGVKQNDKIVFGSDSAASDSDSIVHMRGPKIFLVSSTGNRKEKMGYAGDLRPGMLVKATWKFPPKSQSLSIEQYIHYTIPKSLRELFQNNGCLNKNDDIESVDTDFIFTYNNNIYIMEGNFAIWQTTDEFASIGSGSTYALGSLFTTEKYDLDAKDRVMTALKSASEYSTSVSAPFHFL